MGGLHVDGKTSVRDVEGELKTLAGLARLPRRPRVRSRIASLRRTVDLLRALTEADLRFRYGRGSGRFLRWLLEPFALVGVYLLFVTFLLNRPGDAPGLSLACAVVPFQFVILTVANALEAITVRRPILLNMRFERRLIPISSTLTEMSAFQHRPATQVVPVVLTAQAVVPVLLAPLVAGEHWSSSGLGRLGLVGSLVLVALGAWRLGRSRTVIVAVRPEAAPDASGSRSQQVLQSA